jgi:hypothetical protein
MKKVLLVMAILIASLSLISIEEHKDDRAFGKADDIALDFGNAGGPPVNGPVNG